jgi:hypothetical protein
MGWMGRERERKREMYTQILGEKVREQMGG